MQTPIVCYAGSDNLLHRVQSLDGTDVNSKRGSIGPGEGFSVPPGRVF